MAAYRLAQKSSLQLGLRVGDHLALTNFHSEDLSELAHMDFCHYEYHHVIFILFFPLVIRFLKVGMAGSPEFFIDKRSSHVLKII